MTLMTSPLQAGSSGGLYDMSKLLAESHIPDRTIYDGNKLIIENNLSLDVSDLEVGSAIMLNENSVDGSGLLIYRKTETQFNVLSRECTHNGCSIGNFQEP